MKFSKLSQLFLVSTIGLLVATLLTSCEIVTIDYVFVAGSSGSGCGKRRTDPDLRRGLSNRRAAHRRSRPSPAAGPIRCHGRHLGLRESLCRQPGKQFRRPLRHRLQRRPHAEGCGHPRDARRHRRQCRWHLPLCGFGNRFRNAHGISPLLGTIGAAASPILLTVPGFAGDTIVPTGVAVLANNDAVYVTAYDQSAYNPGRTPPAPPTPDGSLDSPSPPAAH